MSLLRILILALALPLLLSRAAHGEDEDGILNEYALIRVEALMVAMPEKAALAILPELQQRDTIKAGMAKLMKAVKEKTAILTGNPMIESRFGQRCITEANVEERYLIMSDRGAEKTVDRDGADSRSDRASSINQPGYKFETRAVGVTLECEPQIGPDGKTIDLNVVAQRTALLGYHMMEARLQEGGEMLQIPHPRFQCLKTTTSLAFRSGESRLMAVHKPESPAGHIEFVVITSTIIPLRR